MNRLQDLTKMVGSISEWYLSEENGADGYQKCTFFHFGVLNIDKNKTARLNCSVELQVDDKHHQYPIHIASIEATPANIEQLIVDLCEVFENKCGWRME